MDNKKFSFVGPSCGHHAAYSFYKAIKFQSRKSQKSKILSLGEFFFVKIWNDLDIVSIAELQLLWEDKNTNQVLSSLRLYYLPEYTPDGRLDSHGEDELVAVSEKAVLRVTDLLDWIAEPSDVNWDRGLKGICQEDCKAPPGSNAQFDTGLNAKFSPSHSDFLHDVRLEKKAIGDVPDIEDRGVIILSMPQYSRYRATLKRIAGREKQWMHNSLLTALGGFTVPTRNTYVLFCRDVFDYPELEEHEFLCNHLAPKLKGRPRKKKRAIKRAGSPAESESASSESSLSAGPVTSKNSNMKNGVKKDLISILSQKNTKEELDFLHKLISFMDKRKTPIERPPMLGFRQIDLHLFYTKVEKLGGYDGCMGKKSWKAIYDELGGNPQNTSAATCTRRHYEKFLLPFERHLRGVEVKSPKKNTSSSSETLDLSDKESKSPDASSGKENEKEEDTNEVRDFAKPKDLENMCHNGTDEGKVTATSILSTESLQTLVNNKPEGQMKMTPDGKSLQIDDLIIFPNHVNSAGSPAPNTASASAAGLPEGGSALQNLAKIASRYQNTKNTGAAAEDLAKKDVAASQPMPASNKKPGTPSSATQSSGAAAQNLLSLLSPALMASWPQIAGAAGGKGANAGLASAFPLPDPSKLGPEGIHLLQFYEKQLKAATAQGAMPKLNGGTSSGSSTPNSIPPTASPSSTKKEAKSDSRDRSKVCKPPPENKRPPALLQTPCAFAQTSSIYTNPLTEINRLRDSAKSSNGAQTSSGHLRASEDVLDLSFGSPAGKRARMDSASASSLFKHESKPNLGNVPPSAHSNPMLDLSFKRESQLKPEVKASPFSAESLLSNPKSSGRSSTSSTSHTDLVKITPLSNLTGKTEPRASPHMAPHHALRASPASSLMYPSSSPLGGVQTPEKNANKSSPWHTPVVATTTAPSRHKPHANSLLASSLERSSPNSAAVAAAAAKDLGIHPSLASLLMNYGGVPTTATASIPGFPSSLASSLMSSPSLTVSSSPSSAMSQSSSTMSSMAAAAAAASNPYLALLNPGGGFGMHGAKPPMPPTPTTSASSSAAAAAAAAAAGFPAHLMDPATSAYYAALYSQQMFGAAGMNPYAGLGVGSAGLRPPTAAPPPPAPAPQAAPSGSSNSAVAAAAAAAAGLDPYQTSALQAMLRGSGSGLPSGNPPGAAGGANPYSYLGIPGLMGYPGAFPPGRKDP